MLKVKEMKFNFTKSKLQVSASYKIIWFPLEFEFHFGSLYFPAKYYILNIAKY